MRQHVNGHKNMQFRVGMPGCPYFIANTFAHFFGGLFLTGISSENEFIKDLHKKPFSYISVSIAAIFLLLVIYHLENGSIKYGLFALFCILMGQMLSGFAKYLKSEHLTTETIVTTSALFLAMSVVGFFDKGNMLGWETYLNAGLFAIIIAMIGNILLTKDQKVENSIGSWINKAFVLLFALYVAFDVEAMKVNARRCVSAPDYINESLHLYIDYVNLYKHLGSLLD